MQAHKKSQGNLENNGKIMTTYGGERNPNWKGGVTFHTCKQCGEDYKYPGRFSKYCSKECMNKARERKILKVCENCGKEFETHKAYEKRVTCCSTKCKYELMIKKNNKPVICKGCGIEFFPKRTQQKNRTVKSVALFHNLDCLLAWRKKRYAGQRNPRWIGGTIRYRGEDWEIQRQKAAKRDNYTCQICLNIPELLHIHHIVPYRKEKNNSLENLITLCPACHTTEENDFRRFGKPSLRIRRWQELIL